MQLYNVIDKNNPKASCDRGFRQKLKHLKSYNPLSLRKNGTE